MIRGRILGRRVERSEYGVGEVEATKVLSEFPGLSGRRGVLGS